MSEAEFASEAQKAQEQTQAGRAAATAELDMFAEMLEEPDGAAAAAAGASPEAPVRLSLLVWVKNRTRPLAHLLQ